MGMPGAAWAVGIVVGAVALASCGSSSSGPPSPSTAVSASTPTSTSSTDIAPAAALATGAYTSAGSTGKPHYVVAIGAAESTEFVGTLTFVYQDGTTSPVFDFSGQVAGQHATATPNKVAPPGSGTKTVSSVPPSLQIAVGADTLTFEGCEAYLPQVRSSRACTFVRSP